ncbi:MAG: long-chain acyl-CoA synthetase [Halioglobus sp.]|jgi:long-chain acyl-CoA synthetase
MDQKEHLDSQNGFQQRIADVLSLSPDAVAIETGEHSVTWGELREAANEVIGLLNAHGVDASAPIGWAARNRPTAVVAFIALVLSGRMVVPLRPSYAAANFVEDIETQRLQAVLGDHDDWSVEEATAAAREVGSVAIEIVGPPFSARVIPGLEQPGPGPHREVPPGYVMERLTSGTTGAPKRIPVTRDVLMPSLRSGEQKAGRSNAPLTLKRSPALLFKPFSHAGGLFGLLMALYQARPIVLFEKFNVDDWVAAVKQYRPKVASLVPAMIRMVLDSAPDPEALSSLLAIRSGTAPLEPEVQAEFEQRYGVAILVDYGAAEFIGGLAGWTLADHQIFSIRKRGSVGRARKDVNIRVVDRKNFSALESDNIGLIEIKSNRYGLEWIRTNDLARIDVDGFIYLEGRADDAINRGGFKVLPEEVAGVLRKHAAVADAAVVGKSDSRLGQVPVAAIELVKGAARPHADELNTLVRERLPAYMVPVEYRILPELPRTASMKVSRPELRKLLGL